jgi:dihydroorotase
VVSTRLGLVGYPAAAEEAQIARDIALAELTGAHLHICHVSTAGSVALIREAKRRGVRVTAAATPYHLTLSDEWVLGALARHDLATEPGAPPERRGGRKKKEPQRGEQGLRIPSWLDPTRLPPYDPSTRVNPPLRSEDDVEALLEGLSDNTIDAIATNHAPHRLGDKAREYGRAACGISGLETALGLVLTLVHSGSLDIMSVVAKLTEGPAQVLGRSPASLRPGAQADLVIFDPEQTWTVETSEFVSKGKNSPIQGQQLKGQVMCTMSGGDIVFRRESFGRTRMGGPQASRLDGILPDEIES